MRGYLDMLTLPLEVNTGSDDSEKSTKFLILDTTEWLGKDVGNHVIRGTVLHRDVAQGNSLADEMEVNIDVFGASVEGSILGKSDRALIVTEKCCR